MNRRNFFRTMIGGVAAAAAVRTWPFRVYSFPTLLAIPSNDRIDIMDITMWGKDLRRGTGSLWTVVDGQPVCLRNGDAHFIQMRTDGPYRASFAWEPNADQADAFQRKYAQGIDVQAAIDAL